MRKLFFFGELPPRTVHGASISNKINVNILKKKFKVDYVEEFQDLKFHEKFSVYKIKSFLSSVSKSWGKMSLNRYDYFYGVIYLSTFGLLKNLMLIWFFRLLNKGSRIILHFHRSDIEIVFKKSVNSKIFKALNRIVDEYIVLSHAQKKIIENNTSKKANLLYNTIEEKEYEEFKNKNDKEVRLLFLSNLIYEKGICELVNAFLLLEKQKLGIRFRLDCYGSFTDGELKNYLLKELLMTSNNISFHDAIYGEEKHCILLNSDLVILPSYNEGLPLILLESLFYKKPIIITPVGYISEALGEDYPLYCEVKNEKSIIDKILLYVDNLRYDDSFICDLKKKYSKFSMEEHEKTLLEIFA